MSQPRVGILMGSRSDAEIMLEASKLLTQFGVEHEVRVLSAHRVPDLTAEYARTAADRGIDVLIAGAGAAAHLAGVLAAHSLLPVIGVPLAASSMQGLDALLATVQMPGGIPVAAMAIGKAGAKNAALFAIQILSRQDSGLVEKLQDYRAEMRKKIQAIHLEPAGG